MRRLLLVLPLVAAGVAAGWTWRGRPPVVIPSVPAAPVAPGIDYANAPIWAYAGSTPATSGDTAAPIPPPSRNLRPNEDAAAQTAPRHVAGSAATYSLVDVRDSGHVIDWFPGDHPVMPDVIRRGPAAMGEITRGCASCHLPNGRGRPENAPVAGLPAAYFLRQMQDFRNGLRSSADPRKTNTPMMITLAAAMTDAELDAAARYFTAIPYDAPWVRVIESERVPRTKIVNQLFVPLETALSEPIAGRLIETPADETESELLRNPHSGFVAYAPPGSLARGRVLAETGGLTVRGTTVTAGPVTACVTCHGKDLRGVADVPPIAGRSPSYLARQIWDIQQGTRRGSGVALMKAAVAGLTPADLVAVAAWVAAQPVR